MTTEQFGKDLIAYTHESGKVAIVNAFTLEAAEEAVPDYATDKIYLPEDWSPPSGRDQRDLWRIENGQIVVSG